MLVPLFVAFGFTANAETCPLIQPSNYLVFSRGDLHYEKSDFQGLAGAGGQFIFENFEVGPRGSQPCAKIVAGSDVQLRSGHVAGGIETGGALSLQRVSVTGTVVANVGVRSVLSPVRQRRGLSTAVSRLSETGEFFVQQSDRLAQLSSTAEAVLPTVDTLTIQAAEFGRTVISISAAALNRAKVIQIRGASGSLVVINVAGDSAKIERQDIQSIGIPAGHIIFNFPEARSLAITASGATIGGIPATILAPRAAVSFWNGLITGGLYTGSLCGNGQVNSGFFVGWLGETASSRDQVPALDCPPELRFCSPRR